MKNVPTIPLSTVWDAVEEAIETYITNLPFDSVFRVIKLVDEVQKMKGVVDFYVTSMQAAPDGQTFTPFQQECRAFAGHMRIDPATPLLGSITYQAAI